MHYGSNGLWILNGLYFVAEAHLKKIFCEVVADFVSNWIYHLQEAKVAHFLVGAMDDKLLQALAADGVAAFSMASGLTTGDFGWYCFLLILTFACWKPLSANMVSLFDKLPFSMQSNAVAWSPALAFEPAC